jgi:hypothetical protein
MMTAQELLAMQGLAETALGKMLIKADDAARVIRLNKQIAELEVRLAEAEEEKIWCTTWGDAEAASLDISVLEFKIHQLEIERDYKPLTASK